MEYHLEVLGSFEGEFFCLGGVLEQNSDHRPAEKRGWNILNRCYLCKEEEETTNHLPLFCGKARML